MNRYVYRGQWLTVKELSEMSGIAPHTLRDRIRRGFSIEQAVRPNPVHDSVEQFCVSSYWEDWVGISMNDLYEIYWKWCIQNGYTVTSKQGFSRQVSTLHPQIKTVPMSNSRGSKRMIRVRNMT